MDLETDVLISSLVFAASAVAVVISILALRHSSQTSALERIHRITERLYDIDRITMERPELQKRLYEERTRTTPYFAGDAERDEAYFRLKSFIYMQINQFDEIISILDGNRKLEKKADTAAWKRYIVLKMAHPLFREVYETESDIWGHQLKAFYASRKAEMTALSDDDRVIF